METDWDALLLAYLHDPPDKALAIRGHLARACRYAEAARDEQVEQSQLKNAADALASVAERFPAPSWQAVTVDPAQGRLTVNHPLSGQSRQLPAGAIDEGWVVGQMRSIVNGLGDDRYRRLLALWRLLPEKLTDEAHPWFAYLPADTRTPDHTIWQHLDSTAAFQAAEDVHGRAFLMFALGPVQRFIEAARSVRDLWSGSMILSWLAFRAMRPIIEQLGPTALIYPALRGIPLLDLWLRNDKQLAAIIKEPLVDLRRTPSLPHRFLALVPWGVDGAKAKSLATECSEAANQAWKELATRVKQSVEGRLRTLCLEWDKCWDSQIANYFSTATAVVPLSRGSGETADKQLATLLTGRSSFANAFPRAESIRALGRSIPASAQPGYSQEHAGRWQYQVELAGRALAATRTIRPVPTLLRNSAPGQRFPQKCTLLGSFEQMGPDELRESDRFWNDISDLKDGLNIQGVRLRKGEALCAVAMVKRFAAPTFLAEELGLKPNDLRFDDTWTIAAAEWLAEAGIDLGQLRQKHGDWNGQWLHWHTEQDDPDEPKCPPIILGEIEKARAQRPKPPVYYAILKLDGDELGGWLRGENSPKVREVMHPDLVRYYEKLGQATRPGLDAKRPVGPALHAAISTALANFALHAVPEIVRRHHGTTIYSGGDDTLVLLPVSKALACAVELRNAYMSSYHTDTTGRQYLMMGPKATLSGGLVVVHAKDDLRLALQDARRAEKKAKEAGRDALTLAVRRRSGEHTSALCPWAFAPIVNNWMAQFLAGASDRWAYHLYAERSSLDHLPVEAMEAEIRRQVQRSEDPTPRLLPAADLARAFETYRQASVPTDTGESSRFKNASLALTDFLTLCHTASFLARGRDR